MPWFRSAYACVLALAALMAAAPCHALALAPFIDRFERLEASRWLISDGWSNGDWSANDWRRSQVREGRRGISVVLERSRRGDKPFSSGELQSHGLQRYGYFEARLRAPRGSGLVTGFFTFTRPNGPSSWDEIDIEILGRDTRSVLFSYFNNGVRQTYEHRLGFDAAAGWHTYAFEWAPRHIRWYVDGRLRREATGADLPIPDAPQRLYLHLWNSETLTNWVGPIPANGRRWTLRVSCIAHALSYRGRSLCGRSPRR